MDQLLAGRDPGSARTEGGVLDELKRAFAERALNAEMDHHLAEEGADGDEDRRNGYGRKTLLTGTGKLPIAVPRDRLSSFDPQLIAHELGPSTAGGCRASTTGSCRCTPAAFRSVRSRVTWPSSTASTSRRSWSAR